MAEGFATRVWVNGREMKLAGQWPFVPAAADRPEALPPPSAGTGPDGSSPAGSRPDGSRPEQPPQTAPPE